MAGVKRRAEVRVMEDDVSSESEALSSGSEAESIDECSDVEEPIVAPVKKVASVMKNILDANTKGGNVLSRVQMKEEKPDIKSSLCLSGDEISQAIIIENL